MALVSDFFVLANNAFPYNDVGTASRTRSLKICHGISFRKVLLGTVNYRTGLGMNTP
jgi:hypothetical protein